MAGVVEIEVVDVQDDSPPVFIATREEEGVHSLETLLAIKGLAPGQRWSNRPEKSVAPHVRIASPRWVRR